MLATLVDGRWILDADIFHSTEAFFVECNVKVLTNQASAIA
jgi:hypothetical protein